MIIEDMPGFLRDDFDVYRSAQEKTQNDEINQEWASYLQREKTRELETLGRVGALENAGLDDLEVLVDSLSHKLRQGE